MGQSPGAGRGTEKHCNSLNTMSVSTIYGQSPRVEGVSVLDLLLRQVGSWTWKLSELRGGA